MRRVFLPPALFWLLSFPVALEASKLSAALEKAIGQLAAREIEAQFGRVRDPLLEGYVRSIGQELASVSGRRIGFRFRVLDTEIVNAFAAPYGYVYVTKGLLRFVGSEDELAGVIGHEVGHVACRHSWRMIKTSLAIDFLLSTLKNKRWRGFKGVARIASILYLLRHSRKHEYQADERGVVFSYLAGYDPLGVARFLERLNERYRRKPSKFELILSTHPLTSERIKRARNHLYARSEEPRILVRIGDGYASRGYLRRALPYYEKARDKAPHDPGIRARLAAGYALLAEPEKAEREREALASLQPKEPEILALLPHIRAVVSRLIEWRTKNFLPLPPEERRRLDVEIASIERGLREVSQRIEAVSGALSSSLDEAEDDWKSAAEALDSFSRAIAEGDRMGFVLFNYAGACLEVSHRALGKADQAVSELKLLPEALAGEARRMRRALRAPLPPEGKGAIQRAVRALSVAVSLLGEVAEAIEAEVKRVCRDVSRVAFRVEWMVTMVGFLPDRPRQVVETALSFLERAKERARGAYERASKVQKEASAVRISAVEATLNLSTAGFSSSHDQRARVIIARFLGVREEDVGRLRGLGWPYGDVVMALVDVREGGRRDPFEALEAATANGGWAKEFKGRRLNLDEIAILLRLLRREWEAEF